MGASIIHGRWQEGTRYRRGEPLRAASWIRYTVQRATHHDPPSRKCTERACPMNPCIMFGFMRSPLEIIAVKLSSLAIDRSILAITGILMMGLGWILPAEARPPTSVKSAIVRAEDPDRKKQYVALPYAFSAESLGFTVGVGAAVKGYGQDQLLFGGTVFGSTDEAVALFLGMWDYRLPASDRFFFSALGFWAHFPRQRAYTALFFEPGVTRPGSNDSNENDFVETPGQDSWADFKLDYVLPFGAAAKRGSVDYHLEGGMLRSAPSGGQRWNPLTSGVTLITLRQYSRFQSFESDVGDFERTIYPVELGILYDNTDFPSNPSIGSSQYVSYTQDFAWFESETQWNFIQFEASKYFSLGKSARAKQRVVALNFWTGYSLSWTEERDAEGNIFLDNNPPHYEGARLGGFFRMRGYRSNRFNDRSVIYATGEYRYTPYWNPLGRISWLRFLKIDWWQFVLFVEGGRVANSYDSELLKDWKVDAGFGLRAMIAGGVVRFDLGFSDEGVNGWVMVGHPF